MHSVSPMIVTLIGIVLMTVFGSFIARHIGVESWQFAGFAGGLILSVIGPIWRLDRPLNEIEAELETAKRNKN